MSASLIVLIPLVLVGLVGALCFVGCVFPTTGEGPGLGPYAQAINKINGLVAFWPLNDELIGTLVPGARDVAPKPANVQPFDGQYKGTSGSSFTLSQTTIVPGDNGDGGCVKLNGIDGFVSVAFALALNPGSFTLEAWVQPNWTAADPQAARVVLASVNVSAGTGYALFATTDNFWEIQIGTGGGNFFSIKSTQPIELNPDPSQNPVNYLAVTYDNNMMALTLFVGTMSAGLNQSPPGPSTTFVAETSTTATSLFIGLGRPDTMNGMFPFKGSVQDVAVYNVALDPGTIMNNFNLGITVPADT